MNSGDKERNCLADIEAMLRALSVAEPETKKVVSYIRGSGMKALHDLEASGSIRSSLSISHSTARFLASLCSISKCCELSQLSVQSVWNHESVADDLRVLPHEEMRGLYLDDSGLVMHAQTLSVGSASEVTIDPFAALRPAFLLGVRRMELMHNHPSGSAVISQQDIHSVRTLAHVARGVGIRLEAVWTVGPEELHRFEI